MSITVSNQKPCHLSPIYHIGATGYMQDEILSAMTQTICSPILTPRLNTQPLILTDNNTDINEDVIANAIISCCSDTINAQKEQWCKELLTKTLLYYNNTTPFSIQKLFVTQAATKEKLPFASPTCIYTPAVDIIPTAKELIAGICSHDKWFASLAMYANINTLGFSFINEQSFETFKMWLSNKLTNNSNIASNANTVQLFTKFQMMKLNTLTESLILRNDDSDNNEDNSFARLLIIYLMEYITNNNTECDVLPFTVSELYNPKTVVFVNVEKHSQATSKQIANEWNLLNTSLMNKPTVLNKQQLMSLTASQKMLQTMHNQIAMCGKNQSAGRTVAVKFSQKQPTSIDMSHIILRLMTKMTSVNKSHNPYKMSRPSYARANRRNPDDFNKPGKSITTRYKPDIHIYLDTSGSISEIHYEEGIKMLIKMAKKLDINLYFNSFSHIMSSETLIRTKGKSVRQSYALFQSIPKVDGGTDYEQIWNYINISPKRKSQLSIIMTDFEWTPPSHPCQHPNNLYYIPISTVDWRTLTAEAKQFVDHMTFIDPHIRRHVLF